MDRQRVVIVGGGVVGTMHALEAVRRGWEVVHLEADAGPRRASVRNFGLVWLSGRAAGRELELGLRARELWESTAAAAPGVGLRANGSLTVATHPAELALMEEMAARPDAVARQLAVLDGDGVRAANPAVRGKVLGGLLCRRDAVVEPGAVLGALRALLLEGDRYRWLPGRRAVEVGTGTVVDHLGDDHRASVVIVCPGDALTGLGGKVGSALAQAPVRRCRLQMMETGPAAPALATSIADGDSMRYYPAFDLPGRAQLPSASPETASSGMQLLLVQRAAGGLTIGDTHVYDEPFDFGVEELLYDRLRERAEEILGWRLPPVVRRWAGVYSAPTDDRICVREEVEPGVVVVTGLAGRGMTLSPAIAEETWTGLVR
ncbi:MAG TPA: TIGR03364 family FAD-dependent oxidoreductase [Acidimicrobiales bacterium]|nr:TIGR03364 family FAD-dependent oxidoreductase [Acidimicrobiales bacterium]